MRNSGRWVKLPHPYPFSFITERHYFSNGGLGHTYKSWYEDRRSKLTASTFSAALGFHKGRRMELWLEKIGLMESFKGSPATCWNNQNEHLALSRYHLITGNHITFTEFQLYSKCDWLGASPDGLIGPEVLNGGVLEIKCPYYDGKASEAIPWSCIPANYMPQAQGLMEILDLDWMDLYAWTPRGSSLFRVLRNPRYWELVMSALSDFWWDHVVPAKRILESDSNINISHWRPDPKHRLFDVIFSQSVLLAEDSKLLVREINGRIIS